MRKWVKVAILVAFGVGLAAVVVLDIVAATNEEPGDTLSEMVNALGAGYLGVVLALVWGLGFVMGHVFWPQYRDRAK